MPQKSDLPSAEKELILSKKENYNLKYQEKYTKTPKTLPKIAKAPLFFECFTWNISLRLGGACRSLDSELLPSKTRRGWFGVCASTWFVFRMHGCRHLNSLWMGFESVMFHVKHWESFISAQKARSFNAERWWKRKNSIYGLKHLKTNESSESKQGERTWQVAKKGGVFDRK